MKQYLRDKKIWYALAAVVIAIGLYIMAVLYIFGYFSPEDPENIRRTDQNFALHYRQLDGVAVAENSVAVTPIAVMIENHEESRPVSGLDHASIVYEVIVEGDITRYLAIFPGDVTAKKIGPVRSARPFFIELAEEWKPVYLHSGGSQQALTLLKSSSVYNLDEISANGIYFWRDNERYAPHNLYTSASQISRAMTAKEIATTTEIIAWQFKDDQPVEPEITSIPIAFSDNPTYSPWFVYNRETNDYTRHINDAVDKTSDGVFLKAKNIVLQYVDRKVLDSYGRLEIDLTSGGDATIFQDGKRIEGYWDKRDGRTYFFDTTGKEIEFNRGKIWIALLFNH